MEKDPALRDLKMRTNKTMNALEEVLPQVSGHQRVKRKSIDAHLTKFMQPQDDDMDDMPVLAA